MNSNKSTDALKHLLDAVKLCPHDPEIHNALGLIYFAKERFPKSIKEFIVPPRFLVPSEYEWTLEIYLFKAFDNIDDIFWL